jgi:hypothetical protein
MAMATSWDVKAFVDATPISGPACVARTPSTIRATAEPGTFTTPTVRAPRRLASWSAATVSAVCPTGRSHDEITADEGERRT